MHLLSILGGIRACSTLLDNMNFFVIVLSVLASFCHCDGMKLHSGHDKCVCEQVSKCQVSVIASSRFVQNLNEY